MNVPRVFRGDVAQYLPPMDEPVEGDEAPESLLWYGDETGDDDGMTFTTIIGNDASQLTYEDDALPGPSNDASYNDQEVPEGKVPTISVKFMSVSLFDK